MSADRSADGERLPYLLAKLKAPRVLEWTSPGSVDTGLLGD
jgi:hypothetical protein